MNADLVVFGEDWGGHPSSTQHLVDRLAATHKVVWVNSIGLRRPRLRARDIRRAWRKLTRWAKGSRPTEQGGLSVVEPMAVPLPGNPAARAINRHLLAARVNKAMRESGISRPILWLSLPTAIDALDRVEHRAAIYYCGDDFGALAGVDHEAVVKLEAELVERADLILAASPALAAKFPPAKVHLVSHGVDAKAFAAPAARPCDLPSEGPVAGFYGSISEWLDLELLAATARRLPHWRFVLIGPLSRDLGPVQGLPNLTHLGVKAHAELPAYVQNWTVSLLPFCDTAQIRACNPLKLREYLAAGTPVVSTEFPALDGYRDLVRVATAPEDFARALEAARSEGKTFSKARQQRVASETWEARAAQVSALLNAL